MGRGEAWDKLGAQLCTPGGPQDWMRLCLNPALLSFADPPLWGLSQLRVTLRHPGFRRGASVASLSGGS